MSQVSQITIDNVAFGTFRSNLNDTLSALNTTQSGSSRPSSAVTGTIWLDTTTAASPTLKYYDGADDISLATLDHSANTVNWLDSAVSVAGLTTTATGTVLTLQDTNIEVSGGSTQGGEIRFKEDSDTGSNYTALKAGNPTSNVTFTLPTADGTSGQTITTDGSGNLSFADAVGGDNTPSFGATASSTQSITNGGFVKVTLDTENWDTDSAFDNATNYRFTVPTGEGGKYLFNYGAYLVSMTTNGYFQLQLYKNGTQLRESAQRAYMSSSSSASVSIVGSITTSLAAGDYIEFYVIQDNPDGGGGSRTLSDANYKPFLTGFKLIGV